MKVLVIGGTQGFGAAFSRELILSGHEVVTVGRTGGDYLCDVSDAAAWSQTIDRIVREHDAFDLMVCIVGYARAKLSIELTDADWVAHASANLWYVDTALREIPHRCFATTGSQWSYKIGNDLIIPYIQTKHALRELTRDHGGTHYCVPTMETPQLRQVWGGAVPATRIADAAVVARSMAAHCIAQHPSGTYVINHDGEFSCL